MKGRSVREVYERERSVREGNEGDLQVKQIECDHTYPLVSLPPQPWEAECVAEEFPYDISCGDSCGKKTVL